MKRHAALIPLSHDHHHALSMARRLKAAAAEPEGRVEAARVFAAFFADDTTRHFREEEELVFPLLPPEHPLVQRAVGERARLRALVATLRREVDAPPAELMTQIGDELRGARQVRERELFEAVQREAGAAELEDSAGALISDQDLGQARTTAVATAATTTTSSSGARSSTATPAAASPAARGSTTSDRPLANASVTTSAARSDGASIASTAIRRGGGVRPAEQDRAGALQDHRPRADDQHRDPGVAHRRLQPTRHPTVATRIGTPAGVSGVSAKAIAAPISAAATADRDRICGASSARKSAGNAPVEADLRGVADDAAEQHPGHRPADPGDPERRRRRRRASAGRSARRAAPRPPTTRRRSPATRAAASTAARGSSARRRR